MNTYIYKLKHKYTKDYSILSKYGFLPYRETDLDNPTIETIYALPMKLNTDSHIYKYLVNALEKIYENATTEEREEDFKEYTFTEILTEKQKKAYKVTITPELEKELTECQLCIVDQNTGANCLFINAPDRREFYGHIDLEENCKNIINKLLEDKIIYKKKVRIARKHK